MTAPVAVAAQKQVAKKVAAKKAAPKTPAKPKSRYTESKETVRKIRKSDEGKAVGTATHRWMPRLAPAKSTVRYRHILAAEIIVGSILILTDLKPDDPDKNFAKSVEQEAAFLIVFLILSIMTNAGPSAARVSAAIGTVIFLVLMTKQTNIITRFLPPDVQSQPGFGLGAGIMAGAESLTFDQATASKSGPVIPPIAKPDENVFWREYLNQDQQTGGVSNA